MEPTRMYILILALIFILIAFAVISSKKTKKHIPLTPFASLAFGFILAGIFFGENRVLGYILIGIGIILAIIDIIIKFRGK